MKKSKKCYRTITADNYTPMDCIKGECNAWLETKSLTGCVFVLCAATSIGRNLDGINKEKDNGNNDKDSARDGQREERGVTGVKEGGERNNNSDTVPEDIKPGEGDQVSKEVVVEPKGAKIDLSPEKDNGEQDSVENRHSRNQPIE